MSAIVSREDDGFSSLFAGILSRWKLIAASALVFAGLAASYAFLVTPEYQVKSVIRPSPLNELDAINRSGFYTLTPEEAVLRVGEFLASHEARLSYFRANQPLFQTFISDGETLEQSFQEFNRESLSLTLPDPKKPEALNRNVSIEFNYPKGVDGVAILNGFVDYAITVQREQVTNDLSTILNNRIKEVQVSIDAARSRYENDKQARIASLLEADARRRGELQDELKALRNQLKAVRANRMAELDEAIAIASSLGIRKPSSPSLMADTPREAGAGVRTEINNQQIPLYFMGVEALQAERSALSRRVSDDFTDPRIAQIAKELQMLAVNREAEVLAGRKNEDIFLEDVKELRAEAARLRALQFSPQQIRLVAIDSVAVEPRSPVKPKKALIILLGLVIGTILGVAMALTLRNLKGTLPVATLAQVSRPTAPPIEGAAPSVIAVEKTP
ncbi:MAG: GNVR domain-containing protein [Pseudomonas sp.]